MIFWPLKLWRYLNALPLYWRREAGTTVKTRPFQSFYGLKSLVVFGCAIFISAVFSTSVHSRDISAADFLSLKSIFEERAGLLASQPEELACLGAEIAARAWALAAISMSDNQADRQRWAVRLEIFENGPDMENRDGDDLEKRRLEALQMYYDAFFEAALALTENGGQSFFKAELQDIWAAALDKLNSVNEKPGSVWEKKNIISEALTSLLLVTAKTLGGAPMYRSTEQIKGRLKERIDGIERRKDLHFRSRNRLINQAYLRELTSSVFLVGLSVGPLLSQQMASIHAELNRHGAALSSETYGEGLLWTAQAQTAIPLAYWMTTAVKGKGKGFFKVMDDNRIDGGDFNDDQHNNK